MRSLQIGTWKLEASALGSVQFLLWEALGVIVLQVKELPAQGS